MKSILTPLVVAFFVSILPAQSLRAFDFDDLTAFFGPEMATFVLGLMEGAGELLSGDDPDREVNSVSDSPNLVDREEAEEAQIYGILMFILVPAFFGGAEFSSA